MNGEVRGIRYHRYGGPEQMRLEPFILPSPAPGQVAVRIRAAAVNPQDWKARQGTHRLVPHCQFPRGMGSDFAGIVTNVGAGVTRLKAGDEVLGISERPGSHGAFAEATLTDQALIAIKPKSLSFEGAACLPTAGTAVWRALMEVANLEPDHRILVTGCFSAIGRMAVQLAVSSHARVTGSCSATAMQEVKRRGLELPIDYVGDHSVPQKTFDLVLDTDGSFATRGASTLLRTSGGVVLDLDAVGFRRVRAIFNHNRKTVSLRPTTEILGHLVELANRGILQPHISKIAPLADAIFEIATLERAAVNVGHLVIIVP